MINTRKTKDLWFIPERKRTCDLYPKEKGLIPDWKRTYYYTPVPFEHRLRVVHRIDSARLWLWVGPMVFHYMRMRSTRFTPILTHTLMRSLRPPPLHPTDRNAAIYTIPSRPLHRPWMILRRRQLQFMPSCGRLLHATDDSGDLP